MSLFINYRAPACARLAPFSFSFLKRALKFHSNRECPVRDRDARTRVRLRRWHRYVDPVAINREFVGNKRKLISYLRFYSSKHELVNQQIVQKYNVYPNIHMYNNSQLNNIQ